ncbi:MAG TPA: PAS domain S-box protein, partial [Bacteroidota bacterium]
MPKSNTQDGVEDYEEIVRLILENASDLVAVVDFNGKRLYNNKSYQPILGDPNTLKGTNSFEDIHPEDREKIKSVFAETVRTGVGQQASYRFLRKDGSVRYIESQGYVLPGKNGNPAKVILISRDITEQKVAEDSLKNGERRFRALIESSSDAITLVNRKGMITYASPAAENILSVPCDELASQRLVDLIHHDERDVVRSILEEVLTAPTKTATEQLRVKRQNGSTGWVECTLSNMLDDPSVNAIIATFRDITDRKQLEDDLRQIQRMESIGRLAGGVAHDFNNILAIILGYSSAIARAKEHPEKIPQHVDVIQKAAQRGASLVRQLLMFARKTEAIFEQVNVNEVILDAVQMLEETFPKTIRFSLELNTELPHVQADEGQVHQTMVNLCVNARDAIQESPKGKAEGGVLSITTDLVGAEKLRTRFSGVNEERYIRLRISDTGVGMNEVTRARMFEPFFTTKANGKGTGLGLSVVFGIVQNHRGFIDVESKPGSGTTFYLYFPVMAGEGETLTVESASQEEDLRG